MLEKDSLLAKISIIKNCLHTIYQVESRERGKLEDYLVDDIVVLNLERSIQACIDIAHIIIAVRGLKLPVTYKESISILSNEKFISKDVALNLIKMVGFRNIAVHTYQVIRPEILHSIVKYHLKDLESFYIQIFDLIDTIVTGKGNDL